LIKITTMKKNLPIIIGLLISVFCLNDVQAQDPIFSQFYAAPMQTNPAMTGLFDGKFRVTANYKQQWNSILQSEPFRTSSAGFDMRSAIGRNDFLSYGVTGLQDQAGVSGFTRNAGAANVSFMKQLGGGGYRSADQYLIAGVQLGGGQFSLNSEDLWFSTQFDTGTESVNQGIPNNELINQNTDFFLDMSAGLMWYSVFDDNQSLYVGGAIFHANAPKYSFIDSNGEETLELRWMAQFGGEFPLNDQLSVLPAAIVTSQGPSMLGIVGANFRYTNRDWREVAIRAGFWSHFSKNLNVSENGATGVQSESTSFGVPTYTVSAILEMGRVNVGISYDIATNRLSEPTNNRGGFELSVAYVHPGSRKEKVRCPKL
jgi:type IX secretion system PorP/SprF family membrane protein